MSLPLRKSLFVSPVNWRAPRALLLAAFLIEHAAIDAGEDDERVFTQLEFIERAHHLAQRGEVEEERPSRMPAHPVHRFLRARGGVPLLVGERMRGLFTRNRRRSTSGDF
ncbi:MAG TPA: hypothetical protein PK490_08965 [Prosthecobacter sp.]|nr:hypothetical protein [Prosthecobacter sp.]HRK14409.1 hypothetical protein [Prosthecobacter sp.]